MIQAAIGPPTVTSVNPASRNSEVTAHPSNVLRLLERGGGGGGKFPFLCGRRLLFTTQNTARMAS